MKAQDLSTGRALGEALAPLIDVCLELGIPATEFERVVREAFVRRAFEKLPRHPKSGRPPTAHKVSLATGLSRVIVGSIQKDAESPASSKKKSDRPRSAPAASRVIEGWSTDARFQTSGGHPLDLPIKPLGGKRSFKDLVDKYAPSTHAGALIKELTRRGQVQVMEGDIVRFKRASTRKNGLNAAALAEASHRLGRVGTTIYKTLKDDKVSVVAEESKAMRLTPEQLAMLMPRIEQRIRTFLKSIENEFQTPHKVEDATRTSEPREFGLGIYSWDE